jgi:hypothetical protein
MTKKVLNVEAITNELEGASLFFAKPTEKKEVTAPVIIESAHPPIVDATQEPVKKETKVITKRINKKRDTVIPRHHDTMTPRYHDTMIELVRKAVKEFGKEAATHRFTLAEKRAVADIIYTYKSRGVRTSENEISRIAVNYLIEDFKENGEASILDKVLRALND